jgi:hypothetical protein
MRLTQVALRGIMIDVSRHYLPMSAIKRTLDAMSYNKVRPPSTLRLLCWPIVNVGMLCPS